MWLQALEDLYYGEVEGAHLYRNAMQGATRDRVDIISPTLYVQCLSGHGKRIVHFMGRHCDHNIGVG
jgi:hypothetical protein